MLKLANFLAGKWVGVILEDNTGKNNGEVQGKRYFTCDDNRGMFVRVAQVRIMIPLCGSYFKGKFFNLKCDLPIHALYPIY